MASYLAWWCKIFPLHTCMTGGFKCSNLDIDTLQCAFVYLCSCTLKKNRVFKNSIICCKVLWMTFEWDEDAPDHAQYTSCCYLQPACIILFTWSFISMEFLLKVKPCGPLRENCMERMYMIHVANSIALKNCFHKHFDK